MPKSGSELYAIGESEMGQVAGEEATGQGRERKSTSFYEEYVQPVLAELYGSALFIFVGCACVVGNTGSGVIQPALAHGLALGVVIMLFGQIR